MIHSKRIKTFTDRFPLVGPIFWMVSLQFFIVQFFVAQQWIWGYSLLANTISDLGVTTCNDYNSRYVCSPLHALMNASFIVLGCTMVIGSVLIYHEFRRNRGTALGFGLMALAGLGTVLVGLFPENTNSALHIFGAALPFALGNVALIVFGLVLDMPRLFRVYTILSGAVALVALWLFVSQHYFGLGEGGMERLVAHPQTIWLILFGIYMTRNHYRTLRLRRS